MASKDSYINAAVLSNEKVGDNVYKLMLKGNFEGEPGQFYMLKNWDLFPLLSRPLSICDISRDTITFLYLVVGKGTKLLSELHNGDHISLLGPLGNGFKIDEYKKVAIVSGGIGIAPMLYLAKRLNCKIDLYAGFREYDYFIKDLSPYVDNIYLASDLGAVGQKGNILTIYEDKDYDQVFACGPNPMLAALKNVSNPKKLQISLENHMACGIGACLGCTVQTNEGMKRVCVEGPVFIAEEVLYNA
ncbi:MAG: dihydroorotate dehydrogenase electron transfer subunit [Tissierellia bacterium]|nr:dihydroorotate dehydrogenase electron transfer subunit [Tissierellia bacterium]